MKSELIPVQVGKTYIVRELAKEWQISKKNINNNKRY